MGHTATSGNLSDNQTGTVFDSSVIASGSSYTSPPFNTPGVYNYFCQVHPWMTGQVVVSSGGSSITTPTPIQEILNVRVSPTSGVSPLQVSFSASFSSGNPMKNIVWNFGDGNSVSDIAYGTHTYQSSGSYTGTVYVDAMDGTSYTQTFLVTVTGSVVSNANIIISNGASNTHGTCTATSCFNPNIFSANVGQYVTWYNADTVGHTVTSGFPSDNRTGTVFDSSLIASGRTYGFTFQYAGTYNYFCQVHPWMTGQIIVGSGVSQPMVPPTQTPYTINVQTDKSSYSSGSTVTITAYSSNISPGQNVAILVTDPLSNVVASRTIQFNSQGYAVLQVGLSPNAPSGTYQITASASSDGNYLKGSASFVATTIVTAPSAPSGVSIVSIQPTNQLGSNVVTSYGRGTTGFAKVVISSTSSQSALITVNLVGSDGTSLGVGSIDTSLGTGTSQMVVSFYIPSGTSVGTANIYADVYSDWPTNGGTPLTPESSSTVGIQ